MQLEDRCTPAKFTVSLLSPTAGDEGETAATHSGSLTLTSAVTVTAADATAAVKAAFSGTISVTVGGSSTGYTYTSSAGTTGDPYRIDLDGEQAVISLEDMAGQTGCDWDYNDRYWAMMVRQTGPEEVLYTGTYDMAGLGSAEPHDDEAVVTVTVTKDKPGFEGLYHWNYHIENDNYAGNSGEGDLGIGIYQLIVPEGGGIDNISNTAGWTNGMVDLAGNPSVNTLTWRGTVSNSLYWGDEADFSFTSPVSEIASAASSVYRWDEAYANSNPGAGQNQPGAVGPALMIRSVTWWKMPGAVPDPVNMIGGAIGAALLGNNPNSGGGKRIFAEKVKPNSTEISDKAIVRVELSHVVNQNTDISMYLYDVDDPYYNTDPVDWETNPTPADNRGDNTVLGSFSITVAQSRKYGETIRRVSRQPGDNFRAVAHLGNADLSKYVYVKQNDMTNAGVYFATTNLAVPVRDSHTVKSELLTVWRSLHVERDHMKDYVGDKATEFPAADDDEAPSGDLPDLPIDLLRDNLRVAYIEVRDDLGWDLNTRRDTAFVHNLEAGIANADFLKAGNDIRDVQSVDVFWVVQLLAAYEGPIAADYDPDAEAALYGIAPGGPTTTGPSIVFREVIRDRQLAPYDALVCKPLDVVIKRSVLHEVLHRFGFSHTAMPPIPGSNEGPLDVKNNFARDDDKNVLTQNQIARVRSQPRPD